MKLKDSLANLLTKKELECAPSGFDIIGDIAIIEIADLLAKKEKKIGQALLSLFKNIKVVAKKTSIRKGKYRLNSLKVIAGEKRKTTIHVESGLRMALDVEKCYFSPRLSTERLRIASLVKPNERILVMFSGIAPYQLVLAKHSKAKSIVGVEVNPIAHKFALQNIRKFSEKITLYKGDIKKIAPKLGIFDRIIMPLPKSAVEFVPIALKLVKKGTLHVYDFEKDGEFNLGIQKVKKACSLVKRKCKILRVVKVGQNAPRSYRICIDTLVS